MAARPIDRDTVQKIAASVRLGRLNRGWSLRKLADEADLDFVTIWRIEHGKVEPRPSTILRIFQALNGESK